MGEVLGGVVDDSSSWLSLTGRPHDYDPARVQELYQDALSTWRIIAITTDYVVGDTFTISSPHRPLNRFISEFWHHPKNRLDLRLESMSDELSRSGDLFILLFRNDADGMSYLRFVTKDQIQSIETAPNDWETELSYTEIPSPFQGEGRGRGGNGVTWLSTSPRRMDTKLRSTDNQLGDHNEREAE